MLGKTLLALIDIHKAPADAIADQKYAAPCLLLALACRRASLITPLVAAALRRTFANEPICRTFAVARSRLHLHRGVTDIESLFQPALHS